MQIRTKLTFQFILIVAGILLGALFYIHFQFKTSLQKDFYDNLKSKALMMAEMIVGKSTDYYPINVSSHQTPDGSNDIYKENISIYAPLGKRLYTFNPSSSQLQNSLLNEIRRSGNYKFQSGKLNALGLMYNNTKGRDFIVIAEAEFVPTQLQKLTHILVWVFFISITLVALGGWFFARQALNPVNRIMNQVDRILPSDLSRRLESPNQKDELSRLVITFNNLLDRIQNAFNMQKMFLSNISHELKNPLNVIISQIEIIFEKNRETEDYKKTLVSVLFDVKELNEVTTKLMQLARINTDGSNVKFESCRIDELIWQAKASLLKSHPDYTIKFDILNLPINEQSLNVVGNEHLLKIALINLMDNGCKFNSEKSVKVSLSFVPKNTIIVKIEDKGVGISKKELPLIFNPFYRSPKNSTVKGSGIGLALVHSVLKLHNTNIEINSVENEGTTIILSFPSLKQVKEIYKNDQIATIA